MVILMGGRAIQQDYRLAVMGFFLILVILGPT